MKKGAKKRQQGFTLVELMISTVIFSLVLMASTVAMVQISRIYYRGVTISRTQETMRGISDEITQSIQFSAQAVRVPNYPGAVTSYGPDISAGNEDTFYFCIGPKRYSFAIDRQLKLDSPDSSKKQKRHVLWADVPVTGCADAVTVGPATLTQDQPTAEGREMLEENMRITKLELVQSAESDSLWNLNLSIAYGDEDLFALSGDAPVQRKVCEGNHLAVELCATSEISSTIARRVQ